ncbi:MAG: BatA domain-containing protein [Phycisphaerae bacterium]
MTFLNTMMLIGLVTVSIPIIIHLLNRRKARLVDWGAMRFLLASLAYRNRRIMIEEIILLAVRCLLLAMLALALARPFMPSRSIIPWSVVLPVVLLACLLAGAAAVLWSKPAWRWGLFAAAAAMVLAAAGSTVYESWRQERMWGSAAGEKDVAIIIDGSMSMTLAVDGRSSFQKAIDDARAVVAACHPADGICIILAGATSQATVATPTADRKEIAAALAALTPSKGSMRVLEALDTAVNCLSEGHNPGKKIVVITDGQNVGWDVQNDARWQFVASGFKNRRNLPTAPRIVCRTLGLPRTSDNSGAGDGGRAFRNVALTDLALSRKVVGTDRKVQIDVKLTNTGAIPISPQAVELAIDGATAMTEKVGDIQPNASETVRFEHRFDRPGRHLLAAKVNIEDDLPGDNEIWRVADVMERLPVLIVDGAPSPVKLEGAAEFMEVALEPRDRTAAPAPTPTPTPKPAPGVATAPDVLQCLVEPKVVSVSEVEAIGDLSPYSVVVLANVPQLPRKFADEIDRFIREGGGLLIVPGDRAEPEFYNRWASQTGDTICPAAMELQRVTPKDPVHLDLKSFSHAAMAKLSDPAQSDAATARVRSYWPLKVAQAGRVGATLQTASPLLVERQLMKGNVLMASICLDGHDSNLPALKCFVPMMHELVYYLASPTVGDYNVQPGAEVTVDMSAGLFGRKRRTPAPAPAATSPAGEAGRGETVDVLTPQGTRRSVIAAGGAQNRRVSFSGTDEPGLYRFFLPQAWYASSDMEMNAQAGLPFVVVGDPLESRLTALSDQDFERIRRFLPTLMRAQTPDELTAAIAGGVPGEEIWKYLALAALVALVCEIALTRWIAIQRRTNSTETVAFGEQMLDVQTFRSRAKEMLSADSERDGTRIAGDMN